MINYYNVIADNPIGQLVFPYGRMPYDTMNRSLITGNVTGVSNVKIRGSYTRKPLKKALLQRFVIKLQFVYTYRGVIDAPYPR